jgi:uroporphyrinogen decarboxylase
MEQRERVLAALNGQPVDRVPLALWRHHHYQSQTAEGLARATVSFYRQYRPDLLVLTPSPVYMAEAWGADVRSFSSDDLPPYLASACVARATDWRALAEPGVDGSSLQREIDAVRLARAELGPDVPLIVPLYSPLTTANQLSNGRILADLRSFSNDVRSGLATIAALTRSFARACLDAGADGYLWIETLTGARGDLRARETLRARDGLRAREHRDFGQPFDLEVLEALPASAIRILFLEGERPPLDLADRYPVQAVCWENWRATPSMAEARRGMRCGLMGGINPTTLVGGTAEDVRAEVQAALDQSEGWHLVLSPTGPLPLRARNELVAAVHRAIRTPAWQA